jgi:LPS-assembly protein
MTIIIFNISISYSSDKTPILLKADKIDYLEKDNIAIATGNVEIQQNSKIIIAEKIIYNRKNNTIKALGKVSMLQENGSIIFADELELKDDLKQGVAENFSARLPKDALFIAKQGKILSQNSYQLDKVVYTSCPICEKKNPMWQIKAEQVNIDRGKKTVTYKNSFFEIYGMPVFYTPYFSHYTSDAEKRSGILTPSFGVNSNTGRVYKIPYYFALADNKEAIIAPIFTSKLGTIFTGEYNQLTSKGLFQFNGSVVKNQNYNKDNSLKKFRYHLNGSGDFKLNNYWESGYNFTTISDKEYLRYYNLKKFDYITSIAYLKYEKDRDYSSIKTINFTRLHPAAKNSETLNYYKFNPENVRAPLIFPYINYHTEGQFFDNNSKLYLDSNILGLERKKGTNVKRASLSGGYNIPYIAPHGSFFKFNTVLKNDFYYVKDLNYGLQPNQKFSGSTKRFIPEAQIDWRFPLINKLKDKVILIEPIANFIVSKHLKASYKIPNEDSTDMEISDSNLFNSNHFAGNDLIETGPRTNYGLNTSLYTKGGFKINSIFGQNYKFYNDSIYSKSSGMQYKASDYVGRLSISPLSVISFNYRFRADKKDLSIRRNEIGTILNVNRISLDINYLTYNSVNERYGKKQAYINSNFKLTDQWLFGLNARKNLSKKEKSMINTGASLIYKGDCIDVSYNFSKDLTKDPYTNKKGGITHNINFSLKNLTN